MNSQAMVDESEEVLVSVVCITYNHEEYIAEALESFVSQKTDFKFQVLVGDDASTDGTAGIVAHYAELYPNIIKPYLREENMGDLGKRNLIDLCQRAQTRYIALCEGDDYFIDDHKLQKQFEFMEEHEEYKACFHNTRISADPSWYLFTWYKPIDGERLIPYSMPGYDKNLIEMDMSYYILSGPAHTSSVFFRWDNEVVIPDWYYQGIFGDHPLVMLQVGDGLMGFMPDVMSVYRRSTAGIIMHNSKVDHMLETRESWIMSLLGLEDYFSQNFGSFCSESIRRRLTQEGNNYLEAIMKSKNNEHLNLFCNKYPRVAYMALANLFSIRGNWVVAASVLKDTGLTDYRSNAKKLNSIIKFFMQRKRLSNTLKRVFDRLLSALIPVRKNKWAFFASNDTAYSGDARALFEYVIACHPEIDAFWLTRNSAIENLRNSTGLPIFKLDSFEGRRRLRRAGVLLESRIGDGNRFLKIRGYNRKSKIIQLWDGVQFVFPSSLTVEDGDSDVRYSECYHSFVPNEEYKLQMMSVLGVREEAITVCRPPRDDFDKGFSFPEPGRYILYAPQQRKVMLNNDRIMRSFIEGKEVIESFLEQHNITMVVYLSWKMKTEYGSLIASEREGGSRLKLLDSFTPIETIEAYSGLITDCSPLAFDFVLQGKPVSFLNPCEDAEVDEIYLDWEIGKVCRDWNSALNELISGGVDKETAIRIQDRAFKGASLNCRGSEVVVDKVVEMLGV